MTQRTRRVTGLGLLLTIAGLIVWGLLAGSNLPGKYQDPRPGHTDTDLYATVAHRVGDGQNYYDAVSAEQTARGYPTRPAATVREPTLAWLEAGVGGTTGVRAAFAVAAALTAAGLARAIASVTRSRVEWFGAVLVASGTIAVVAASRAPETHEAWAGLLLAAACCVYRVERAWPTAMLLLAACLIRELVVVTLLALLVEQLWRRQRSGVLVAGTALATFLAFYAWHTYEVLDRVSPSGRTSPGWFGFGGWPGVVDAVRFGSPLVLLPYAVSAVLIPLAVLGWASRRGLFATGVGVTLGFGCLLIGVVARPDNAYWGLMFTPLLAPGLAFVPAAARDCARSAFRHANSGR